MIIFDADEKTLYEVRRHWFVFAAQAAVLVALALAPLIVGQVGLNVIGILMESVTISYPLLAFGYVIWLIIIWIMLAIAWSHYYLDVWVITNKRIVDFDFKGFFHYETTSLRLDRIQDITVEVNGLLANLFGFGALRVETAGENTANFVIYNAANPDKVKHNILTIHHRSIEEGSRDRSGL